MKKPFLFLVFALCSMYNLSAQNVAPAPCIDPIVTKSADSLLQFFRSKSFSLAHRASLTMESEYESAIITELKKGNTYVLAFICAKTSKLFQVSVYDRDEHRVAYEKQKSFDKEGNILIFSYRPDESGFHIIRPLQSNKRNKEVCGELMLFKKDLP